MKRNVDCPHEGEQQSARSRDSGGLVLGCHRWGERYSSGVWRDDRATLDLSLVKEVVRVGRSFEGEVFHQHLDLSGLGEADHFDQLWDVAPVGRGNRAFF